MRGKFFISLFLAGGVNCQNGTEGNGVSCYTCDTTLGTRQNVLHSTNDWFNIFTLDKIHKIVTVRADSNGIVVGIGSAECFSSEIHDSFLQPCQESWLIILFLLLFIIIILIIIIVQCILKGNATVCVNEMEVDWFFYGAQLYRMKRGCSAVVIMKYHW